MNNANATPVITLTLSLDEVMQLGNAAADRPYREVGLLLRKMENQVNAQMNPPEQSPAADQPERTNETDEGGKDNAQN